MYTNFSIRSPQMHTAPAALVGLFGSPVEGLPPTWHIQRAQCQQRSEQHPSLRAVGSSSLWGPHLVCLHPSLQEISVLFSTLGAHILLKCLLVGVASIKDRATYLKCWCPLYNWGNISRVSIDCDETVNHKHCFKVYLLKDVSIHLFWNEYLVKHAYKRKTKKIIISYIINPDLKDGRRTHYPVGQVQQ